MFRVELDGPDDTIIAPVGQMIYKSPGISWRMTSPGQGLVGKLSGSVKRRMSGETAMQCHFSGRGEVGFGGTVPGMVFLHAAGDFVEFNVQANEEVSAELGSMVYYDSTVDYTVRRAGGLGTALLGGEGIVLAHFVGPGRITLQTDSPESAVAGRSPSQTAQTQFSLPKSPSSRFSGPHSPFSHLVNPPAGNLSRSVIPGFRFFHSRRRSYYLESYYLFLLLVRGCGLCEELAARGVRFMRRPCR